MKDFPTIKVVGYDVHLSWVSLVKAALTDRPDLPVPPAETSVITIHGEIAAPAFTITLKQQSSKSDQRLFTTLPHPHSPNDIILFVPAEPIDTAPTANWLAPQGNSRSHNEGISKREDVAGR